MARAITVQIVGDSRNFTQATEEASRSGGKFGGLMTGIAQGLGQGIFNAAASAIAGVVGQIKASDQIFRDDQVSAVLLGQALKDNVAGFNGSTTAIEKTVAAQAKFGFGAVEVRNALGQLIGVTHDQKKATDDLSIAENFARAHHLDLATATDIVAKASEGNFKSLKQYGINLVASTAAVDALKASHQKYTPEQLAAAKAQDKASDAARALAAMTNQAAGAASAYANTSAGKLAAAQAQTTADWVKVGAIVDRISQVVIPAIAGAFTWLVGQIDPVTNAIQNFMKSPLFGPIMAGIAAVIAGVGVAIMVSIVPALWWAATAAIALSIPLIPLYALILAIGVLVALVAYAWVHNFGDIQGKTKAVIEFIRPIFQEIKDWFEKHIPQALNTVKSVFGTVFSAIGTFVSNAITDFVNLVNTVKGLPAKIGSAAAGMWDGISGAFKAAINWIITHWDNLKFTIGGGSFAGITIPSMTLGVPQIPTFDYGGTVPGPLGSRQIVAALGGEHFGGAQSIGGGGNTIHIHMDGIYAGDGPSLDLLANRIAQRLSYVTGR